MEAKNVQPSLFPEPASEPKPPGFDTMDVDTYADRVAASAPADPYLEQKNRERRSVGLPPEPADIVHAHGRAAAKAPAEAVTGTNDTIPDGLRLEDPALDAGWQALRAGAAQSVPTESLSSAEQNANAWRAEAAHLARTSRQIVERTE